MNFQRPSDGSFWKDTKLVDSNDETKLSGTTTARCYMALVYAERCLKDVEKDGDWKLKFREYVSRLDIDWGAGDPKLIVKGPTPKEEVLNNFEIAHVADLAFVKQYLDRFSDEKVDAPALDHGNLRDPFERHFLVLTDKVRSSGSLGRTGRLPMQGTTAAHFFVNLHAARACAILGLVPPWNADSFEALRRYCLEQCFYAQRGLGHKLDPVQLILACVTVALLDDRSAVNLYEAAIDALHGAQLSGGNWPATHPVFLPNGRPWHITSHEMALCLTWLYHVNDVPEPSRQKLLAMLERYFEEWVVKTYVQEGQRCRGWYDDHHVEDHYAVGWATSIVCHVLANYYWILGHEVNRLVIESLGLEDSAEGYSFDPAAPSRARRPKDKKPLWPDLPPYAWDPSKSIEDVAKDLQAHWTDPSVGKMISRDLAKKIIGPILETARARPAASRCSGMLNGPPGTRKTSFVRRTANAVGWPLVTVPGSVILSDGWDAMEARATEVFRRLHLLANCVIFFDEYEEFFRERPTPIPPTDKVPVLSTFGRSRRPSTTEQSLPS